jgi:glutaminase
LRNFGINQNDPIPALENYFRQCALEVSCRDLAFMAATLANGGVHPLTGERAATPDEVESVLSVMSTCGMYDYAGGWLYEVGMPAKSGVGGGIIAVLPGRFGIGVFSPPLDEIGNSARGIAACRELSHDFGLHAFGPGNSSAMALNRVYSAAEAPSRRARPEPIAKLLASHAGTIRYLELQGEIAVDGAEHVARKIVSMRPDARYFILDMNRVTGLTPSAAHVLQECARRLLASSANLGGSLVMSRLSSDQSTGDILGFTDKDQAVEWCENRLLAELSAPTELPTAMHPGEFSLFVGLDGSTLLQLEALLTQGSAKAGEVLMRAGQTDDDRLLLLLSGEVSVLLPRSGGSEQRLATLGPGGVVGEMVLLGQSARMATVRADQDVTYLGLSRAAFEQLALEVPQLKITVLDNLARELARKLGQANQLIGALAA